MYTTRNCGPSRNSFWSGRNSIHNAVFNDYIGIYNRANPDAGYSGTPINMTMIPGKLASVGYTNAIFGWYRIMKYEIFLVTFDFMFFTIGKWDTGQAVYQQFPIARGFDHALTYQSYGNDYWTCTLLYFIIM